MGLDNVGAAGVAGACHGPHLQPRMHSLCGICIVNVCRKHDLGAAIVAVDGLKATSEGFLGAAMAVSGLVITIWMTFAVVMVWCIAPLSVCIALKSCSHVAGEVGAAWGWFWSSICMPSCQKY